MTRFFAARLRRPVYADELERLDRYAQSQTAQAGNSASVSSGTRRT